jgi:hypothetical protein
MRAATRETIVSITAFVLVIGIGFLVPKAAQSDKYSKMELQSGPTERPHPCIKSRLTVDVFLRCRMT